MNLDDALAVARRRYLATWFWRYIANPIAGVWAIGCVMIVVTLAAGSWMIWQLYEVEKRQAIESIGNVANSVSGQMAALMRNADVYLLSTANFIQFDADGSIRNIDQTIQLLHDWQTRVVFVARIIVVDDDGRLLADSRSWPPHAVAYDAGDAELRFSRADADATFFISNPFRDRISGEWLGVIRRPLLDSQGNSRGAIELAVQLEGLVNSLAGYNRGQGGSISLLFAEETGEDRTVWARVPYAPAEFGRSVRPTAGAREANSRDGLEVYFGPGFVDGVPRLFATKPVPGYRLYVTAGTMWRNAIARWYDRAPLVAAMTLGTVLLIAALTLALAWQITRRLEANNRLQETLHELVERRRSELEAQQSKLDALARLSGGVAHEFSNLLQPITSLSQIGRTNAAAGFSPTRTADYFDRIGAAARQAIDVASDFLTFASSSQRRGVPAELAPALHKATRELKAFLPLGATLNVTAEPGLVAVFEPLGLAQVVTNLVKNAVEAWERAPEPRAPLAIEITVEPGRRGKTRLTIADNGPGMTEEVRARVFEPFFTTKGASGGTGLGLAVVYGVVTSWGGQIAVISKPRQGATFVMIFQSTQSEG